MATECLLTATVEAEIDPREPGRTAFRVTSQSRQAVEDAVFNLMNQDGVTVGRFTEMKPAAQGGDWIALGYTIIRKGPHT